MTSNDFKVIFDSTKHEIDVETLIGCLMHTSNIVHEVNRTLDTEKKIELKIKALEGGSFEIYIELIEKTLISLFSNTNVQYGASIITIVESLYKLVKFLEGKKAQKIEFQEGDNVKITNINGNVTTINKTVYNIYSDNKSVRDSICKQFSGLSKNPEVSGFKFESETTSTHIHKEDFENISKNLNEIDKEIKEPLVTILKDKNILIIRPSFIRELGWDFVFDNRKISAKIKDDEITKIIDNGETFAKGDHMLVDIEVTKFYDAELDTYLINNKSYKIIKYKKHIKGARQQKLFD